MSLFMLLLFEPWSWLCLIFPSRYPDPPSADREDIDTVIEDVAKDAAAEAEKIATEEAAKDAAEGAAKESAGSLARLLPRRPTRGLPGRPARPLLRRRWLTTNLPPPLPLAPAGI